MKGRLSLLLVLFFIIKFNCAQLLLKNENTVTVQNFSSQTNIFEKTVFYKEQGRRNFDIKRLSKSPFYKPEKLYYYLESLDDETLWMKFSIINKSSKNHTYYYTLRNAYLYNGTLYWVNNNKVIQSHTYNYQNIKKENTFCNYPTWKIQVKKNSEIVVYVRVYETGGRTKITSLLKSEKDFLGYVVFTFTIHGLFIFFFLGIVVFSVYLSKTAKKPFILFYGIYVAFLCVDYLCVNGIGQSYLWTNVDFLIKNTRSISNVLSAFFLCLFFYFFYSAATDKSLVKMIFLFFIFLFGVFLALYVYKYFFGGFTGLFLYVWKSISILSVVLIVVHLYLGFKKIIPIYLPIVFIIHALISFINANYIFPYTNNIFWDWVIMNIYHLSLGLEVLTLIYFVSKTLEKKYTERAKFQKEYQILQRELDVLKQEKLSETTTSATENVWVKLKSKAVLNTSEILYIKSDGHYVEFHLEDKNKPEIDRNSLSEVLKVLPSHSFVRIHRSYIVNIYRIKIINSTKVMLDNGAWINLSRTYKQQLKNILHKE